MQGEHAQNKADTSPGGGAIEFLYRYRPIDSVLDKFHELETQEIYFSTTEELNDPLEGFKDLFWSGDRIVWRNLLRHYIFCLQEISVAAFITRADFEEKFLDVVIRKVPTNLPNAPIQAIFARMSAAFLDHPAVRAFLAMVTNRSVPMRANELTNALRTIHSFALDTMFSEFADQGLVPKASGKPSLEKLREDAETIFRLSPEIFGGENASPGASEALFAALERTGADLSLIFDYNHADPEKRGLNFFCGRFPALYVRGLAKLVHHDWYVACFSSNAANANMWVNYAGGHRGVCLKFRTPVGTEGKPTIKLNRIVGMGGPITEPRFLSHPMPHPVHKVGYDTCYPAIDFFRSLATLNYPDIDGFWYLGEDGTFSSCRADVLTDEATWKKNYWSTFTESALCKTSEWSHEDEYRVVMYSLFDMSRKEARKLKYSFDDLAGIVFGARTSHADRLRIMKIVDERCGKTGRTDFEFSEMIYSAAQGQFVLRPMPLLKLAARPE